MTPTRYRNFITGQWVESSSAKTDDIIGHAPPPARGRILSKAGQLCCQRADDIARRMTREEGTILKEARGAVQKRINRLESYAGQSFRIEGRPPPGETPNTFVDSIRQPLGVVSCITPWNFPVCVPVWKIAPALVAGNTIVFKAASNTPAARRRW